MTRKDAINAVMRVDSDAQRRWLIRLGFEFTICARTGYPVGENPARLEHLIAFNEMQHQVYNYLIHTGNDWSMESFLEGLFEKAKNTGVEGDFGWAIKSALKYTIPGSPVN